MNANELRIGNLILHDKNIVKVTEINNQSNGYCIYGIGLNGYTHYGNVADYFTPIPLTEDILLKCGGRPWESGLWIPIYNLKAELHFEIFKNTDEIVTNLRSQFCELIFDRIKYLHTLQNLVHSLTGEELKIEL